MYESFSGNGMLCNPEAIFRELLAAEDMEHLQHIWVLAESKEYEATVAEFRRTPNVRFVKPNSLAYHRAMATSQYLINNSTFPAHYGKRSGQTYLNTWHGTPLKHMGYDMPRGGSASGNIVRNFAAADYLLSSSPFMTDEMYASAYRLQGFFQGKVVETGQPRVDRQFLSEAEQRTLRQELMSNGIEIGSRRIALYAPTWRGESFHNTDDQSSELIRFRQLLESELDTDEWCVLLKVHQAAYAAAAQTRGLQSALVPNSIPTNKLLGITDVLITDYSSIFFDYLVTGKPVLFHIPDFEGYRDTRGLYSKPEDWPGPFSQNVTELAKQIRSIGTGGPDDPTVAYKTKYEIAAKTYCPYDDGESSKRVVDTVFRGHEDQTRTRSLAIDGRRSILINLGGLALNGITTSGLNLLHHIDYDRYDVSAFYRQPTGPNRQKRVDQIDSRARSLRWVPGVDTNENHRLDMSGPQRRALLNDSRSDQTNAAFDDEWRRCFGACQFDHVIDFSGYAPFWARLFARRSRNGEHSIWLHNDLAAERDKKINGVPRHYSRLGRVFEQYCNFDRLVSVSSSLSDINRKNLAQYADPDAFVFAQNTINAERVLEMARGYPGVEIEADAPSSSGSDSDSWSAVVRALAAVYESDAAEENRDPRQVADRFREPMPAALTFVTAGRLSPEKNHERLIRAFARVHELEPLTKLIILGNGPLLDHLEGLAEDLKVGDSVLMTGHVGNPYAIIGRCNCFVLSSDYEGQPMTILEARVLGLPVVSTSFGSVANALPASAGIVVDRSVVALSEGMLRFAQGDLPEPAPFDYDAYNNDSMEQFYRAIGSSASVA